MGEKLIVDSDHKFNLLFNHNVNFDSFELNLPRLNDVDNKLWTEILAKDYSPCGCAMGGKFVLLSLVISTVYLVFQFQNLLVYPLKIFGQIMLFVFVMSLVGKLIGIFMSKIKFRKNMELLRTKLSPVNIKIM